MASFDVSPQDQPWSHLYMMPLCEKSARHSLCVVGYWLAPAVLMGSLLIILLGGQQIFSALLAPNSKRLA